MVFKVQLSEVRFGAGPDIASFFFNCFKLFIYNVLIVFFISLLLHS